MRPALSHLIAVASVVAAACSAPTSGSTGGSATPKVAAPSVGTSAAGLPDAGATPEAATPGARHALDPAQWVNGSPPVGYGAVSQTLLLEAGAEDGVALVREVAAPAVQSVARFDGSGWARVAGSDLEVGPTPRSGSLGGAWASSSADVWVAVESGFAHFDGRGWTVRAGDGMSCGATLSGAAPGDVWAAGPTAACHWDGTAWSTLAAPPADFVVKGIWSDRPGSAWLFGFRAAAQLVDASTGSSVTTTRHVVLRWNGAGWDLALEGTPGPHEYAARFGHIGGAGPAAGWAFGSGGTYRYDGASWTAYVAGAACPAPPGELDTVWASPLGVPWALPPPYLPGSLYGFDGSCWTALSTGPWVSSAGGWVSDGGGAIWRAP